MGSFLAGMLGSLTGLGGGVVIVPLLTLVFGVDIRYAIGASLVSVIATSSGAAAAYLREGYSNMRVGMFLEIATTVGAVSGAFLAGYLHTSIIAIVFGLVLLYSAYTATREEADVVAGMPPDRIATARARAGRKRPARSPRQPAGRAESGSEPTRAFLHSGHRARPAPSGPAERFLR